MHCKVLFISLVLSSVYNAYCVHHSSVMSTNTKTVEAFLTALQNGEYDAPAPKTKASPVHLTNAGKSWNPEKIFMSVLYEKYLPRTLCLCTS